MDRRAYLISVFDDTLERINGDFELHKAQQQSIAAQKLILEKESLDIPAPRFEEKAQVIVTKNRSFEAAAQYIGQHVCVLNSRRRCDAWFVCARGMSVPLLHLIQLPEHTRHVGWVLHAASSFRQSVA